MAPAPLTFETLSGAALTERRVVARAARVVFIAHNGTEGGDRKPQAARMGFAFLKEAHARTLAAIFRQQNTLTEIT